MPVRQGAGGGVLLGDGEPVSEPMRVSVEVAARSGFQK